MSPGAASTHLEFHVFGAVPLGLVQCLLGPAHSRVCGVALNHLFLWFLCSSLELLIVTHNSGYLTGNKRSEQASEGWLLGRLALKKQVDPHRTKVSNSIISTSKYSKNILKHFLNLRWGVTLGGALSLRPAGICDFSWGQACICELKPVGKCHLSLVPAEDVTHPLTTLNVKSKTRKHQHLSYSLHSTGLSLLSLHLFFGHWQPQLFLIYIKWCPSTAVRPGQQGSWVPFTLPGTMCPWSRWTGIWGHAMVVKYNLHFQPTLMQGGNNIPCI